MSRVTGLSNLLEEAQHMLSSVGEVLASTMQQGIGVIKNYEELAATKIASITESKRNELAQYTAYGESVKSCVEKRQSDLAKIEEKLKNELADCYRRNNSSLDKILAEKSSVHEEALKLTDEIQKIMQNCMSADNKQECLSKAMEDIKKRVNTLPAKIAGIAKKEIEARTKAAKAVIECDKKAVEDAGKKCIVIMNDVKKCAAANR